MLYMNDGYRHFADAIPGRTIKVRDFTFPVSMILGQSYGTVWEYNAKGRTITLVESGELQPTSIASELELDELNGQSNAATADEIIVAATIDEVNTKDNRNLVDSNTSQSLSVEQLHAMRQSGADGSEIIKKLVQNSATFANKTAFSQEKYLRRKHAKYVRRFRLVRCTALNICETLMERSPEKIGHLRWDSLAHLLSLANIQAGHNTMVFDHYTGLLVGAVAERMVTSCRSDTYFPGNIFLPFEDNKQGPNLHLFKRFNLIRDRHFSSSKRKNKARDAIDQDGTVSDSDKEKDNRVARMLVGVRYRELLSLAEHLANGGVEGYKAQRDVWRANLAESKKQKVDVSASEEEEITVVTGGADWEVGVKREREEEDQKVEPSTMGTSGSAEGIQEKSAEVEKAEEGDSETKVGAVEGVVVMAGNNQTWNPMQRRKNQPKAEPKPDPREKNIVTQLKPWNYTTIEKIQLIENGLDSIVMAVPTEPIALFLSALRFAKPSCSFAVFSLDSQELVKLFKVLRTHELAVNLQLSELWTRESQVLPSRTHPTMNMHGASGFILSGTIVQNKYMAISYN